MNIQGSFWVDWVALSDYINGKHKWGMMIHSCGKDGKETDFVKKHQEGLVRVMVEFRNVDLTGKFPSEILKGK